MRRAIGLATLAVALAIAASSLALSVGQFHSNSSRPPGFLTGVCWLSRLDCYLHYNGEPITLKEVDLSLKGHMHVKAVLPYQIKGERIDISSFLTTVALAEPVSLENPLYAEMYIEAANSSSHIGLHLELVAAKREENINITSKIIAEKTINLSRPHIATTVSFDVPDDKRYAYYLTINVEGKGYVLVTLRDPLTGFTETRGLQADPDGPGHSSSTLVPLTGGLRGHLDKLRVELLSGGPVKVVLILRRTAPAYVKLITADGNVIEARVPVLRWIR